MCEREREVTGERIRVWECGEIKEGKGEMEKRNELSKNGL